MAKAAVLERLASAPEFTPGPGCTPDQIAKLETFAGGRVPQDYREFLVLCGCAIWDGGKLFGCYELGSLLPDSIDLDAARRTKDWREDVPEGCFTPAPRSGLVVSDDDSGGFYFLNVGSKKNGAVDHYVFGEGEDNAPTESWPSFTKLVEALLDQSKRRPYGHITRR
jgi:hypothetical protein